MQVYCSCPCEFYCKHMYVVILLIRNNKYNKLYKISCRNPNDSLLKRIINFNWCYCVGVDGEYVEIINDYGEFQKLPIIDENKNLLWRVIEDSKDNELSKDIKKVLNKEIDK